jgi:uncharacterized repeat protein (TIGR01451 family)
MSKRILLVSLILGIIGLALAGCMRFTTLVVTPLSAIVEGGGTVTFTAADSAGDPVAVTWSVSGLGTITADGVYIAPATVVAVTNATITATQVGYVGIMSSATVTIEPPEPPAEADLIDAAGDTFSGTGTAYDVKSITTSLASTALTVSIEFTAAPTLPLTSGVIATSAQLAGFLCFDTDEDPATGWLSANSYYCPCATPGVSAIGVEYFVDLFSRDATGYPIRSTASPATPVGRATPSLTGNILTLTIPLTSLGGDDGITGMNALLGNGAVPGDCVPDSVAALVTGKAIVISHSYRDFLHDTYGIYWGTAIEVTKTPSSTSVQSGSVVAFDINVQNTGAVSFTLTTLTNDIPSGETVQTSSCTLLPAVIDVGESYTCTYEAVITGDIGDELEDTVTATAIDVYEIEVTASDTAKVTIIAP